MFDEDEGCGNCWEWNDVDNPLEYKTEKEFLEKLVN